jgi:hypothetical protein
MDVSAETKSDEARLYLLAAMVIGGLISSNADLPLKLAFHCHHSELFGRYINR